MMVELHGRITMILTIHADMNINVWTKFHHNPSNSCCFIKNHKYQPDCATTQYTYSDTA